MQFDNDSPTGLASIFQRLSALPGRTKLVWLAVALVVLTGWTYFPAIGNGFVNFDDPVYVTDNAHVKQGWTWANFRWAAGAVVDGNWHPLTLLSHMLDCQFFGLAPWGHHLTSVLLHLANTVLLFLLLQRMTAKSGRSFFVAALFGLHPLHVESVAWVAERKDVLSTFFGLLAMLAYTRHVAGGTWQVAGNTTNPAASAPPVAHHQSLHYWLALSFFGLGLMAKPMLVTLPCVLLLLDYWPLERFQEKPAWKLIQEKWPFFALASIVCVVTLAVQNKSGYVIELATLPFPLRLENALVSYVRYLGGFFYPADLCAYYPRPRSWPIEEVIPAGIVLAVVSAGAVCWRRRRPWLLTGWLWFLGTLVPVIGLVQVGQQSMADRYTYVPLIGIFIAVTWGIGELTRSRPAVVGTSAIASAILVACMVLTRAQIHWWKDSETLLRRAISVTEDNWLAYNNLGVALEAEGRFDEAAAIYRKILAALPDSAPFHCNLGTVLDRQGQSEEALRQFQEAIKDDPNYASAYTGLGQVLSKKGRADEAVAQFQTALRINPDDPATRCNLGRALDTLGRFDEAISQFQQALDLDPGFADAHASLGLALGHKGSLEAAARELATAARLNPGNEDIRYNLGNALVRIGQLDEAIAQFQAALKIKPDDAATHNNLGTVFYRTKHLAEAIAEFQTALKLRPDYTEARQNLDTALRVQGAQAKPSKPSGTGAQAP